MYSKLGEEHMKLTIGMATHTDYYGTVDTIQHIRMTNRRIPDIEILVVDSSIGSQLNLSQDHTRDLKNFSQSAGFKLIEMVESEGFGTTQARNRVFEEATGDIVLCIDCHVLIEPFALDRLIEWFEKNPDSMDLIQGPILHDNLQVMATGFADEWRDEMWGIWELNPKALTNKSIEDLPIIERQNKTADIEPFEIKSMGLGLFGCRKEAWLGFNKHFRGFGGEEWYIHRKYRKAGRKCLCLPFLRWWHRFGRPGGIAYTITTQHKVRNYILGHMELDDSLAGIHQQFVQTGKLSQEDWNWLIKDPENHVPNQSIPQSLRSQGELQARNNNALNDPNDVRRDWASDLPQPDTGLTLDQVFEWCKSVPRDLDKHLDAFKYWASKCEHVTEFTERRESTIGLLAARPIGNDSRTKYKLVSYNTETDFTLSPEGALHKGLEMELDVHRKSNREITFTQTVGDSIEVPTIEPTDLLFIDTKHNGSRLSAELLKHGSKVNRAIMIHDTSNFGEKGDDGGPGLNEALRNWINEHPEWFVAFYNPLQYGMTIISKHPDDAPKGPINAWPPGFGPGTELKAILSSVGIDPSAGCDCNAKALQMDLWGSSGCQEHFDEIVNWMREGEERWGWKDKWEAAAKLLVKDPVLAFSLNPKDPFPGLVKASIKRARKHELKSGKNLKKGKA